MEVGYLISLDEREVGVLPGNCGRKVGAVVNNQDTFVEFRAQWHVGHHRAITDPGTVDGAAQEAASRL
jgi:hypothetical protein